MLKTFVSRTGKSLQSGTQDIEPTISDILGPDATKILTGIIDVLGESNLIGIGIHNQLPRYLDLEKFLKSPLTVIFYRGKVNEVILRDNAVFYETGVPEYDFARHFSTIISGSRYATIPDNRALISDTESNLDWYLDPYKHEPDYEEEISTSYLEPNKDVSLNWVLNALIEHGEEYLRGAFAYSNMIGRSDEAGGIFQTAENFPDFIQALKDPLILQRLEASVNRGYQR